MRYRERYKAGQTPLDVGRPDFNLIEVVTRHPVPPGKAMDIGCGTGDNALWLARNGFQVTGTDTAEIAHSFPSDNDRSRFARNVAAHLEEAGLWLTLVGSPDERRDGPGPPQRTAGDIVLAVEPFFEILALTSSHFESNRPNPPRAWRCLMQKRRTT